MTSVEIRLYDLFRKKLNLTDDKAAAFVSAVDDVVGNVVGSEFKNEKHIFGTKDDIVTLSTDIHRVSSDVHRVNEDLHKLEIKLEQTKLDLYKAMFWTSIVQLFAILGGVLAIVKFMK